MKRTLTFVVDIEIEGSYPAYGIAAELCDKLFGPDSMELDSETAKGIIQVKFNNATVDMLPVERN